MRGTEAAREALFTFIVALPLFGFFRVNMRAAMPELFEAEPVTLTPA